MIYFTSDTHFYHRNIIRMDRPQFETIEEHDDYIFKVLEKLTQEDILYHLGDLGFLKEEDKNRLRKLKCRKILIKGNHDRFQSEYYKNLGFSEVYNTPIFLTKRIVLSHEPIPVAPGVINVHGHLHGAYINEPNYVNVNISECDYHLISMKHIEKRLLKLKKDSTRFLEEWYADKYTFTVDKPDIVMYDNGLINLEETLKKRNPN